MKPVKVPSPCAEHATRRVLLPQFIKAQEILNDGNTTKTSGAYRKDGIGREIGAIPEAEVEGDWDGDGVDEDERPEPGYGEPTLAEVIV